MADLKRSVVTVTNATDVTEEGIALDARQNNANIEGTLANKIESFQNKSLEYYSLVGGEKIPANANLNDYLTVGNYYCDSNVEAYTILNCPTNGTAFTMKVMASTGFYYPAQYIRSYHNGTLYYRVCDGVWQPWYCIKTEKVQS